MGGGLIAAAAGYVFTYFNSRVQEERKARIERVNLQLKEFYGPLLACVSSTKSAYDAMVKQHSPDGSLESFLASRDKDPNGKDAKTYRLWMRTVLQPLNEQAAAIITAHIDLLESDSIEPELLQLVAHVYAYRVILTTWDEGDYSGRSVISYPDKLVDYIRREFGRMKLRQAELFGNGHNLRSKL